MDPFLRSIDNSPSKETNSLLTASLLPKGPSSSIFSSSFRFSPAYIKQTTIIAYKDALSGTADSQEIHQITQPQMWYMFAQNQNG